MIKFKRKLKNVSGGMVFHKETPASLFSGEIKTVMLNQVDEYDKLVRYDSIDMYKQTLPSLEVGEVYYLCVRRDDGTNPVKRIRVVDIMTLDDNLFIFYEMNFTIKSSFLKKIIVKIQEPAELTLK